MRSACSVTLMSCTALSAWSRLNRCPVCKPSCKVHDLCVWRPGSSRATPISVVCPYFLGTVLSLAWRQRAACLQQSRACGTKALTVRRSGVLHAAASLKSLCGILSQLLAVS